MRTRRARAKWTATVVALATVGSMLTVSRAWAATATVGGVKWSYTVSGSSATVTGASPVKGNVAVPSSLGGYTVTSIGDRAFYECQDLTGVTIPEGVTSMGEFVFTRCRKLTKVTILGNVTNDWIDGWGIPFSGCTNIATIALGDQMTKIGAFMFIGCSGLTSLTIPDGVTSVGEYAFRDCSKLADVTIGQGVTSIGEFAFGSCGKLTKVTILGNVTNDWPHYSPFVGSASIATVVLGDKMTKIGEQMFSGCSGLTSLTIPDGVKSIGDFAFSECAGLTSMKIPNSVTDIGFYALNECTGLKTLYAPASWRTKIVNGDIWTTGVNLPSGCEVIYYETKTATSAGVPYSWLEGYGLGDGTEEGYEAAAGAEAANGMRVWECYMAGLDPTDAVAEFTTTLSFTNGVPVVSWEPDLNEGGKKAEREYVVEGKETMEGEWDATNAASRFFRVKVGMP